MNTAAILEEFQRLGVRLRVEDGDHIIAKPISAVPPDLREAVIEHQVELIEAIRADEALRLLNRLKTFTVPADRISEAREMVERAVSITSTPMSTWRADSILTTLRAIEREMIALGGSPDSELADAVAMVERAFGPRVRLIEVRKPDPDISREDRARLRTLGYSTDDIDLMKPITVQRIFDHYDHDEEKP